MTTEGYPEHTLTIGKLDVELEDAFADSYLLFSETTRKYMEAYRQLEEQFESLNLKLEETNNDLRHSLEEKDRVSNYLNNIIESMSGGVLVVDPNGCITLFNQEAEAITGCLQDQVLGRPYEQIIGLDAGRNLSVLHTLETSIGLSNQEKDLKRNDGHIIPLGFSTSLVRDTEGHILGAVEVFNDMTEVKRLEAQVQRMHTLAALGEMAATVAHEIRNPLGGIAGFAALLERDLEKEDPRRRLVQKITEGVGRLNRIVTSLLSYTRPLNLRTHPVDLATMVEEVTAFFEIDLERHNRTISIHRHHGEEVVCPIDTEQFQQVILNLLQNATQAISGDGEINIQIDTHTCGQGTQGRLKIRDSGSGMSPEVQEKLFTPFFTTKEDGTGLGLVISKKIIEAHGGTIQVESQQALDSAAEASPNDYVEVVTGTTFTISLPL